ncbi:MAG: hypothetical protein ACUBOA_13795 [Candidatus Loosdrechtia sp.]|uniref:hypothetical protein n=1 Tax=Candidatus Loosdrechtia sp. TaxID=3101272 RepID=UPI003A6D02C6|nr:MAG: hypothetical protein QY305_05725 [Candidatus Jettenia sp. AMX2]
MSKQQKVTFQDALDVIESLPVNQQESLIDIVRHRLVERRRDLIARHIRKMKEEYRKGEVKRGSVDDLVRDLQNENDTLG